MKCYIDKFKSKHNLDVICKELLSFLSDETLNEIVRENTVLRLRCNLLKNKDINKTSREKVEKGILSLYKTNEELNSSISDKWNSEIQDLKDLEHDELKDTLKKEEKLEYLFKCATLCWSKNDIKFNLLGDKIFALYLKRKKSKKISKQGVNKMSDNILDLSLGEIINAINNKKVEEQNNIEELVKQNSNEIKELSSHIDIIIKFNKEVKKMLNGITDMMKELEKEESKFQSKTQETLDAINKTIKEVSKEVNEIKDTKNKLEQDQTKEIKNLNANIKFISDSMKNQNKMLDKLKYEKETLKEDLQSILANMKNLNFEKKHSIKIIDDNIMDVEKEQLNKVEINNTNKKDTIEEYSMDQLLNELLKSDK